MVGSLWVELFSSVAKIQNSFTPIQVEENLVFIQTTPVDLIYSWCGVYLAHTARGYHCVVVVVVVQLLPQNFPICLAMPCIQPIVDLQRFHIKEHCLGLI